jgi:hypothetical protein
MDKISFNLDPGEWHLTPSEAVWAERLIEKHSYEIRNIPYFVKGISYLDEITAVFDSKHGSLEFSGVILKRSGHSTYRLVANPAEARFQPLWDEMQELGCTYDALRSIHTSMGIKDLFAVDLPPETDIYKVYEVMQRGKASGVWLFQEGYVGHLLRDNP